MTILEQMLEGTGSVAILGHIRPDGDCLGSALGLYNYLRLNCPRMVLFNVSFLVRRFSYAPLSSMVTE